MKCSVYPSRTSLVVLSAVSLVGLAAWAYFILPGAGLPSTVRVGVGVFFGAGLLACLVGLLARRPLLRVDETGIAYHPGRYPKIEWPDVLGVERVPLIEPTPDGLINHGKDGWRPLNIFVVGSDKYLRKLRAGSRQRPNVDAGTDAVTFRFAFVGRSPSSAEVYDCIRRHLDARGVNA